MTYYTPARRDPKAPPIRINLLSDTQTRPTPGMREAMARAEVGDEQVGDDPSVNLLCDRVADLMGKEAAVFLPSGTMCNVTATLVHCRPGDEILAHGSAHIIAREGGAQYIVTTDADGQYNPAEIESLVAPIVANRADFVTGSRRMGSEETRDPVRRAGVRFFAILVSALTGQKISDTTFGLRAMRAEVTGAVRLDQPQYQASELLIGVIAHGYKVLEVPATIHKRSVGASKKGHNLIYGLRFMRVVVGTWWRERRAR